MTVDYKVKDMSLADFGRREIAIADYRRLEKPKEPLVVSTSTWRLAQIRLKAMGVEEVAAK